LTIKRENPRLGKMTSIFMCLIFAGITLAGCYAEGSGDSHTDESPAAVGKSTDSPENPKRTANAQVTFVELGSDRCIPCIKMREVIDEIQQQYGDQVRIVFHDVWTPQGEPYARQYGIRLIPTQVFLDDKGQEYYRHEGYFPIEAVAEILARKGVRRR
jgi:thioredoxin 1